ncbi:allatostatin-A receptor-like [Patiria miniata]|uniref:G-protein coupled receptors family 1 profile domain-containing protein n=1 Tax=Patiria miniata TaxID=46514 RepID=A0A913ZBD5_PATMI|nr:allatostatin-A receptor-like [Patiria miniata]
MEKILALLIYKTIIGILGVLGNGLVCMVIGRVPAMRSRTNAFILNQAVIDFFGSVVIILQTDVPLPDPLPNDAVGWIWCHIWISNFMIIIFFVSSTFNLLALTLERYFAIVYPYKYQSWFSSYPRLKVVVTIACCWIFGVAIKSYTLMIVQETTDGRCVSRPIPGSKAIGILTVFLQYILPVFVMLFAYIHTSVELKRQAARVGPLVLGHRGQSTSPEHRDSNQVPQENLTASILRARRNVFKTLMMVFATFLVCWSPNQILFLMFNFGWEVKFSDWYFLLTLALVATNSCVNPFIYALKYQQFRSGLRQVFCRGRPRVNSIPRTTDNTATRTTELNA